MPEYSIKDEDLVNIESWISEGIDDGSHYHGMSYEEGMRDMLELLNGYVRVNDIIGN